MVQAPPPTSGESSATILTAKALPVGPKAKTKARADEAHSNPPDAGLAVYPPDAGDDCPLPVLPALVWEQDRDGGWEAWHAPEGRRTPRRLKTYLGRMGKRKLAGLLALPDEERRAVVEQWVADRRAEKGLKA